MKDELKKCFHSWYAEQMQEQLKTVPVMNVKVDVSASTFQSDIITKIAIQAPSLMDSRKLVFWMLLLRLFNFSHAMDV